MYYRMVYPAVCRGIWCRVVLEPRVGDADRAGKIGHGVESVVT